MKVNKLLRNDVTINKTPKKKESRKTRLRRDHRLKKLINQGTSLQKPRSCSSNNECATTESDDLIILTPSKSESDCLNRTPEFEESLSLVEASFNSSVEENDSYTYDSVIDELVSSEVQCGEANVVSLPDTPIRTNQVTQDDFQIFQQEPDKDQSSTKLTPASNTQYHYTSDGIVAILHKNASLYFHGLMSLSVLRGEVEVLGYRITKDCRDVNLYSLRSASLLCVENVTNSNIPIAPYILKQNGLEHIELSENCAIVLCKKLPDPSIAFIEKHVSQQILPRYDETPLPRVVFHPQGSWNLYKSNEQWNTVIDGIHASTKMLICGGKGVGKSTFLRYAINRLLMKFSQVQVVDLDPGQPEFTIPGSIAIVKISEPLFGANFTHLKTPERSIVSNINIAYDPAKYIASIKCLLETVADDIPTLVNYMGFTHGIGINIVSAVVIHLQPTDIVQINSGNNKKNYKQVLTPDVVKSNARLFTASVSLRVEYNLHVVASMCDENDGWTAEPRQLREMNILAYLSRMAESNSLLKSTSPLYRINLRHINITDLSHKTIHPAAINASLVALCSIVERSQNIFECHGWGIVRGVDTVTNELLILTLEQQSVLAKVSSVVLNSALLPPSIFMTPDEVVGQIPYVMEGTLMSLGQIPKRSHLSVKNKE